MASFNVSTSSTSSSASTVSVSASDAPPSPSRAPSDSAFSFGSTAPPSLFSAFGRDERISVEPSAFRFAPLAPATPATPATKPTPTPTPTPKKTKSEGVVTFPSRGASEFRYRLSRTKSDTIRIWLEDKSSKQQWESKELALGEIVTPENTIPAMQLSDYFESFKSSFLAADTGLFRGANKHDLVSLSKSSKPSSTDEDKDAATKSDAAADNADDEILELQLTLAVQVFSKVITPTYRFELHRVTLTDLDVVNARLRDQNEEIEELRAELEDLSAKLDAAPPCSPPPSLFGVSQPSLFGAPQPSLVSVRQPTPFGLPQPTPAYLHATTASATRRDHPMAWTCDFGSIHGGWFQLMAQGGVRFLRAGVYSIVVAVHHVNTFNPNNVGLFGSPPPGREAFQLRKNGEQVAVSFGSTETGTLMTSPLSHILSMLPSDELSVMYCGTGVAMPGCSIVVSLIR